jgi:Ring finger domain
MEGCQCAICHDSLDSTFFVRLPCQHTYHNLCFLKYKIFMIHQGRDVLCPYCRHVVLRVETGDPNIRMFACIYIFMFAMFIILLFVQFAALIEQSFVYAEIEHFYGRLF